MAQMLQTGVGSTGPHPIPENALRDENGDYILDENGNYILTDQ